jgi:hypothetical protein
MLLPLTVTTVNCVEMLKVLDENQSPHLFHNYEMYTDKALGMLPPTKNPNFVESNLKYSVNGYLYCNQPEQVIKVGERVRWYMGAMGAQGSEHGVHTPHYHGNTWHGALFPTEIYTRGCHWSHACSLQASRRVTNDIPLGCSLLLPVGTVNCVQTLKG